jgi:hypothetical protein
MNKDNEEASFLSMPGTFDTSDDSSSSEDSDIEVMSMSSEEESYLVTISNGLRLNSDEDTDDDMNIQDNPSIGSHSQVRTSTDKENSDLNITTNNSSSILCPLPTDADATPSQKRKRRAWSVKEKLQAIDNYEQSKSKHSTAKAIGCTRYQLAQWLKTEEELKKIRSMNNGEMFTDRVLTIPSNISRFYHIFSIYFVDLLKHLHACFIVLGGKRKRLKGGGKKLNIST